MSHWINKYFDSVYVITLPERKSHMKSVMRSINVNPTFFPAYLAKNLKQEELINRELIIPECNLSRGQVACHLSHCGVLGDFLKNKKAQSCLVFEDDISIPDKSLATNEHFEKVLRDLPEDWDVLYLGRCWDSCNQEIPVSPYIVRCFQPLCRHAIAFSRKGAKKIIDYTLPMNTNPGDRMISELIQSGTVIAYCASPAIFFQNREKFDSSLRMKTNTSPPVCRDRYDDDMYEMYEDLKTGGYNFYLWIVVLVAIYLFYRHIL